MRVPLLVVVALLACGLWFLARDRTAVSDPVVREAAEGSRSAAPPDLTEPDLEDEREAVAEPASTPGRAPTNEAAAAAPEAPLEDGGLRVRVLDSEERPAVGVRVELVLTIAGMGEDDRGAAETRVDGWARIDLEDVRELQPFLEQSGARATYSVQAKFPTSTPVAVVLEGAPADGDEVRLELPPTGGVDLTITLPDGGPVDGDASYAWWWLPADVADADPNASWERPHRGHGPAPGGRARIDGLGLGLALEISARAPGRASTWQRGILGPTRAGEVVPVTVALGEPMAAYRFRVLDPSGRPVAEERLFSALRVVRSPEDEARPPRSSWSATKTGADGVVEESFGPSEFEHRRRLVVERGERGWGQQEDPSWSRGEVEFPRVFAPGETLDLGDVRLVPARTLLEGSVVDPEGAPVARADVWLRERWAETRQDQWTNLARVKTDEQGVFHVRGVHEPRFLEVSAYADGYESTKRTDLEVGETGVVLTLAAKKADPNGAIAVHVILDEGVPFMRCLLKFRNERGQGRSPDWASGFEMEVDRLPPGTYDVWVETRDGDFELARVSGIVVEAGETTRDAQLLPFDVRGTARVVTLEAVRPGGAPWRRTELTIQAVGVGRSFWIDTDDLGRAAFILPLGVNELEVRAGREGPSARVTVGPGDDPTRVELAP